MMNATDDHLTPLCLFSTLQIKESRAALALQRKDLEAREKEAAEDDVELEKREDEMSRRTNQLTELQASIHAQQVRWV